MRPRLLPILVFIGLVSFIVSESEPELYKRCVNEETGERYREAETWTQEGGCVECMCMKSGPECDEIECAEPVCVEKGYRVGILPGKCCPGCIGPCTGDDGEEYGDGESWSPDPCTDCTCVVDKESGRKDEICATVDCAFPVDCPYDPITPPGQCCPICPKKCVDASGKEYGQGESWSPDPCTDCTCEVDEKSGRKEEFCATADCFYPQACPYDLITPPDQCCPICPCTDPKTGETHKVGESFKADPCTDCVCTDTGGLECNEIMCDYIHCPDLGEGWRSWSEPGSCCPGCVGPCTDDDGTQLEIGDSWKREGCQECVCETDGAGGKKEKCVCLKDDEECKDTCGSGTGECHRYVTFGEDEICLDEEPDCSEVMCPAVVCPNGQRTLANECCPSCIPDKCAVVRCAVDLDCDSVYISQSPCCPICVTTSPTPAPPPDKCALVRCAEPECDYPITFVDECCPSCMPDHCAMVDCMPVHPNCEPVYTKDQPCCPVCDDPPECPKGEIMAECFFDPCETAKCSNYPTAECRVSFCGECTANFYDANGDIISNCDGECPGDQIFKDCGSACTATCKDPLPACTKNCVSRCECPTSAPILYKQICMPENECPNYLPYCDEVYSGSGESSGASSGSTDGRSDTASSHREDRSVDQSSETPGCEEPLECPEDLCETEKCKNFPYAKCRIDNCGKCQAVFYHDTGLPIEHCEGDCPRSMKFNSCGSACTRTCSNPNPMCIEMCVPRCECTDDAPILMRNECAPLNECSDGDSGSGSDGDRDGKPCRPRYPEPIPPPEPECDNIVNCFVNPCDDKSCSNYPLAKCVPNYCGGCNADFYDSSGAVIRDCEGRCEAPKTYTECGSACPQTCFTDPYETSCIAVCVPGCSCPKSAPVLYGGKCITREQCPARMDADGAVVFDDDSAESGKSSEDGSADSGRSWDSESNKMLRDSATSVFSVALTLSLLTAVRLFIF